MNHFLFLFLTLSVSAFAKAKILFMLTDDMGYSDISCYGAPDVKTPAIDSLARDGLRFNQMYVRKLEGDTDQKSVFDLAKDPGETQDFNLKSAKHLKKKLKRWESDVLPIRQDGWISTRSGDSQA